MQYKIWLFVIIASLFIRQTETVVLKQPTIKITVVDNKGDWKKVEDTYYVNVGEKVRVDCKRHPATQYRDDMIYKFYHEKQFRGSSSFLIDKMTVKDRGMYYCEIQLGNETKMSDKIHLEVNLHPTIYFQPVTEGEDATFICSLQVAENITFAWYINQQKQDGQNGKEFTIYNIKRSLKGSNVTCEVLLNGLAMKTTTKAVDVYWNDRASVEILTAGTIYESEEIILRCIVDSNPNPTSFYWWENGKGLSQRKKQISRRIGIGGNLYYRCAVAKKKYEDNLSPEKYVSIAALFTTPTLTMLPTSPINTGSLFSLNCSTIPKAAFRLTYRFYHQDGLVPIMSSDKERVYTVDKTQTFHKGNYYCVVSLDGYPDIARNSSSVSVEVELIVLMKDQSVDEGEDATFTCVVAGSENVQYEWFGHPECSSSTCTKTAVSRSDDNMKYKCQAVSDNGVRSNTAISTLTVYWLDVTMEGPSAVVLENSLDLQCKVDSNPNVSQITWYKNDKEFPLKPRFPTIATKEHTGIYSCAATINHLYKRKTSKLEVSVLCKGL